MVDIIRGFVKWSQDEAPTTDVNPFDVWYDTSKNYWKIRTENNDGWYVEDLLFEEYGDRGVFGGGDDTVDSFDYIDYITISTIGNAIDFGDLTYMREHLAACSNGLNDRGIFAAGVDVSGTEYSEMDYITISTTGNAIDFANLSIDRFRLAGCSNGTNDRGVFGGGDHLAVYRDNLRYITISTLANAIIFGDLTKAKASLTGLSNGINERGLFAGGTDGSDIRDMDYITISTPGNAIDFGDLTSNIRRVASCSNGINERGIIAGGEHLGSYKDYINYVTISTTGNAINFGDLTVARDNLSGTSNVVLDRGVFAGGVYGGGDESDVIDYITISTTGDATDFGDLLVARRRLAATSDA